MESVGKKTIPQGKKIKKKKATDSSSKSFPHVNVHPNGPLFAPPMMPIDTDDGISYKAIGGVSGDLLEQNAQIFNHVSTNFSAFQVITRELAEKCQRFSPWCDDSVALDLCSFLFVCVKCCFGY